MDPADHHPMVYVLAAGFFFCLTKHQPGFLEHAFCGVCDFVSDCRAPLAKTHPKYCPSKTCIEILCKKTCCIAPHVCFSVLFLG